MKTIIHLLLLVVYCCVTPASDLKGSYYVEDFAYTILGTTKIEAIADGIQEITEGNIQVIPGQDFANTKWVVNSDGQMVTIEETSEYPFCYTLEYYPLFRILNEEKLMDIKINGIPFCPIGIKTAYVCSRDYAAWFNTTIMNYLLSSPEMIARYKASYCTDSYGIEFFNIFRLWDESGQPAEGVPQRPW